MTRKLQVETGDVTLPQPRMRSFRIQIETPFVEQIHLSFDNTQAAIEPKQWHPLVQQIKMRSLAHWQHSEMPPPMGIPELKNLIQSIPSTPAYQLLLAIFEIATATNFVDSPDDETVHFRCRDLNRRIPSLFGLQGLFFIPESILAGCDEATEELVQINKLCRFTASIANFRTIIKYYLPYATPQVDPKSSAARSLWDRVRSFYYAAR